MDDTENKFYKKNSFDYDKEMFESQKKINENLYDKLTNLKKS